VKNYGVMPGTGITGKGKSGSMKPPSRAPQPASRFAGKVKTFTDRWTEYTYAPQLTEEYRTKTDREER